MPTDHYPIMKRSQFPQKAKPLDMNWSITGVVVAQRNFSFKQCYECKERMNCGPNLFMEAGMNKFHSHEWFKSRFM